MIKFSASNLSRVSTFIGELQNFSGSGELSDSEISAIKNILYQYIPSLEEVGCSLSSAVVRKFLDEGLARCSDWKEAASRIDQIREVIVEELESKVCLTIPLDRVYYWQKSSTKILGDECSERFPSAIYDVEEAFNCYAVGRFTACAFHLMRVSESGVTAMAKSLGCYNPAYKNWGNIFQEVSKQYDAFNSNRKKAEFPWDKHSDFLKKISGILQGVNASWRNSTMHLEIKYTEEEAKTLCDIIPKFLKQISEKLDQEGNWLS